MALRQTVTYWPVTLDANGEATPMFFSKDFRNATFTIIGSNTSVATIKFYASNSDSRPDLTAAASSSNVYTTAQVVDLNDGSSISWSTGLVLSSDGIKEVEINQNNNTWVGAKITAYTSGTVTVSVSFSDNQ